MFHMNDVRPNDIDFKLYDFVSGIEGFCFAADNPPCDGVEPGPAGTWPWPVTTTLDGNMAAGFTTGNYSGPIGASGIRIHEFLSEGTNSLQLSVDAAQPSKVVIVRLN